MGFDLGQQFLFEDTQSKTPRDFFDPKYFSLHIAPMPAARRKPSDPFATTTCGIHSHARTGGLAPFRFFPPPVFVPGVNVAVVRGPWALPHVPEKLAAHAERLVKVAGSKYDNPPL
ncbi:MAG: hypothetical protein RBS80_06140 [Thermoguttaceae bacterium]|nr:hypothetical protein [Thermoguttaceae bacterium]